MNAMKLVVPLCIALAYGPTQVLATPILSSDLASFAVLGAAAVTNVPTSTIVGNVGVSPGSSITGFNSSPGVAVSDPQVTGGLVHATTGVAAQAQLDLDAAILTLSGIANTGGTLAADLTGTRTPGVYEVLAGTTNLSGALILDGGGSDSAVWVFRFASTLITDTISNVSITNVGDGSNVGIYWLVGSAATLNGFTFIGNVLAHDDITSDGNLTLGCGRLLSATTKVTLIQDTVSIGCTGFAADSGDSGGFDQGPGDGPSGVPEPGTVLLLGIGLAGLIGLRKTLPSL